MFRKRRFSDIELETANKAFRELSIHNGISHINISKKDYYLNEQISYFENQRKRKKLKELNSSFECSSIMQIDEETKLMTTEVDFDDIEVDLDSSMKTIFSIDKQFIDLTSIHYEKLNLSFLNTFIGNSISKQDNSKALFSYFSFKCLEEYTLYRVFKMFIISSFIDSYKSDFEVNINADYDTSFSNNLSFSNIINNKFYSNDDNYYNVYFNYNKANFIGECINSLKSSNSLSLPLINNNKHQLQLSCEESRNDYSADDEGNFTSMDLD